MQKQRTETKAYNQIRLRRRFYSLINSLYRIVNCQCVKLRRAIVFQLVLHGHWKLILSLVIPTKTNFYEFLRILKIT